MSAPVPASPAPRSVSPLVAALLSLVVPGVGQIYIGQRNKGIFIFVAALVTCALLGLVNLLAAIDAFALARKLRRGETIGPYESSRLADWLGGL